METPVLKKCNKCITEKDLTSFSKKSFCKDGLDGTCKECKSKVNKKWKENNKGYVKTYRKQWKKDNPDKVKLYRKTRYKKHFKKINEYMAKWNSENPEKVKKHRNTSFYKRYHTDKNFKFIWNLRGHLRINLKKNNMTKEGKKTFDILGIDFVAYKSYLESKFEPWMNWSNYGKHIKGEVGIGWDIDHIIPLSSAKNKEEVFELLKYSNTQPLDSHINRYIKRDKTNWINKGEFRKD